MKHHHTGITIRDESEVQNFYCGLLGMKIKREFILNTSLAKKIFNLSKDIKVIQVQQDDVIFEIFICPEMKKPFINHQCLVISNRDHLVKKAKDMNYTIVRIEREMYDLIFLHDNSGNIFELKGD
jgi:catechol-2,3-dioxygenase